MLTYSSSSLVVKYFTNFAFCISNFNWRELLVYLQRLLLSLIKNIREWINGRTLLNYTKMFVIYLTKELFYCVLSEKYRKGTDSWIWICSVNKFRSQLRTILYQKKVYILNFVLPNVCKFIDNSRYCVQYIWFFQKIPLCKLFA